jgi:hypothetical protein
MLALLAFVVLLLSTPFTTAVGLTTLLLAIVLGLLEAADVLVNALTTHAGTLRLQ